MANVDPETKNKQRALPIYPMQAGHKPYAETNLFA